jgi:hypothetical protein
MREGEERIVLYERDEMLKQIEALQAENEQLQAQVARVREALIIANHRMPDVGHFCACGKCKTCGADINYAGYEHCVKCARVIIDAALSDTPADYHNPADVEALQKAMEAIKAAWSDGSANAAMDKASGALAAIDKAIGGAESNKIIKAQRQEIEKLKATLADWKYNAKCDADHIAALTADKDEQTEQMKYLLRRTLPILEVTNDQQELIDAINALIGGEEDV